MAVEPLGVGRGLQKGPAVTAPSITITRGRRVYVFTVADGRARPVRVFEDFGAHGGTTEYRPPDEWTPEDVLREAEERIAATVEPRRKKR